MKILILLLVLMQAQFAFAKAEKSSAAVKSFDTGYTISKVRTLRVNDETLVLGSSHKGTVLVADFNGKKLWQHALSGYMNHDIWADDLDGDGVDEILAANADGHIYCLSSEGELLWSFKANDAPMYSVTVVHKGDQAYVAAGGYDTNFYYLDKHGKLLKTVKSADYSLATRGRKLPDNQDNPRTRVAPAKRHTVNFLRPLRQANGEEVLVLHGVTNSMQTSGALYLFKPLETSPFQALNLSSIPSPMGDIRILDMDGDGDQEVVLGGTKVRYKVLMVYNPKTQQQSVIELPDISPEFKKFGYRIAQAELINEVHGQSMLVVYGNDLALISAAGDNSRADLIKSNFSFNDMWHDAQSQKLLFASSQSGGSAIHVIDPGKPSWRQEFADLSPPGNIARILQNTQQLREQVDAHGIEDHGRDPIPVYLMSDYRSTPAKVRNRIHRQYQSPLFMNFGSLGSEKWDRSVIKNPVFRDKRDRRQKYDQTQAQILKKAKTLYKTDQGASYWGGHGNDPYFRSLDTHLKTLEIAKGKHTVMVFPELENYDSSFEYMLSDFMYPLAEAMQQNNGHIFLRNKHTFWQSTIYKKGWSRLMSGEFADVFVPAMEETTDKSMELSLAARSGLWASGVVNQWGTRFSRDNTSFDRLRQHSHQMLPNHALRQFVYHSALGATFVNNFAGVDQDYLSVYWELLGKQILFVPKPHEVLSYSPVHLSIIEPDNHYLDEGNNVKPTTFFDQAVEDENPMVFSRLNGSWPGAPVTEWDFSRYAANVSDRHLNFLPNYPNGMVLITPPQQGVHADKQAVRGSLVNHLHPIYRSIMAEFYTDGRDYYSADGKQRLPAKTFYKEVKRAIEKKASLLPITVEGDLSWVVAQTSPRNLRLTLVDGGYIAPKTALATISFNTIKPVRVRDILNGEEFTVKEGKTNIQLPTGLFRFIDIELPEPLVAQQ